MIELVECLDARGRSLFKLWFDALDPQAAAIVAVALERLADGNTSRAKPVGEGAAEVRIDRGPGYRIYLGWEGKTRVVLLRGGTKRRQQRDIAEALALWRLYKARKVTTRRR
jgi:putative addiction module killer protein